MRNRIVRFLRGTDYPKHLNTLKKRLFWHIRGIHIHKLVNYPIYAAFGFLILSSIIASLFVQEPLSRPTIRGFLLLTSGLIMSLGAVGPIVKNESPGRFPYGEPYKGKFFAYFASTLILIWSGFLIVFGLLALLGVDGW